MSICIMLKTMKKKYTQNLNDDFLVLFRECYKKEEIIPEVFEQILFVCFEMKFTEDISEEYHYKSYI